MGLAGALQCLTLGTANFPSGLWSAQRKAITVIYLRDLRLHQPPVDDCQSSGVPYILPTIASPTRPLLAWLQLLRLPTVFTALADIVCGFLVGATVIGEPGWRGLPWLLLSSAGLYLGGMVLNDVFDARLDAVERPERPIPSGRISVQSASVLGCLLMTVGLVTASLAATRAGHSFRVAALIAIAVLAYNAILKKTWAGPFGMGICRFLNLSLGASTAVDASGDVMSWQLPVLGVSTGLAVYIAGVTWFARNEAGKMSEFGLFSGLFVAIAGIAVSAGSTLWTQGNQIISTVAVLQFGTIVGFIAVRGIAAIRKGKSAVLQRMVGTMLLWIIMLDAAVVFSVSGSVFKEAVLLLLLLPAILLRKRIPMS